MTSDVGRRMVRMPLSNDMRVGQLSCESRTEIGHALGVSQFTSAVSIVELIQVPVQVLGVNVNVRALKSALELSEVVLAEVRTVRLVSGVNTGLVVHNVVTGHSATER